MKTNQSCNFTNFTYVLLQVDALAQIVTIGNPLYGQQLKTFDQMQKYWTGEAVVLASTGRRLCFATRHEKRSSSARGSMT